MKRIGNDFMLDTVQRVIISSYIERKIRYFWNNYNVPSNVPIQSISPLQHRSWTRIILHHRPPLLIHIQTSRLRMHIFIENRNGDNIEMGFLI